MKHFFYEKSNVLRILFFTFAFVIVIISSIFTYIISENLAVEEYKSMELWAEAERLFTSGNNISDSEYALSFKIIKGNKNIPVVLLDENGKVINYNNLELKRKATAKELDEKVQEIINQDRVIKIDLDDNVSQYIYYGESNLLHELRLFPIIQLLVMFFFLGITVISITITKTSEQNKVWVGLSKETAHQLGTPISSLMAWVEVLKLKKVDPSIVSEISKDTDRLKNVADRFSKIGSIPNLNREDLIPVLNSSVEYMSKRISKRIKIKLNTNYTELFVMMSIPLFEWVIENLCKNAVDALDGSGNIILDVSKHEKKIIIDVSDDGKGMSKSSFKRIFKPGFTTKSRGWGLGLSLAKRIIEENHNGKIFVKSSNLNHGTTFRIILDEIL